MEEKREFLEILMGAIRRETEAFNCYFGVSQKSPSAGHEPQLLFEKDGHTPLIEGHLLPCMDQLTAYRETFMEIHSGDSLILFTDGVVESMNADEEEFSVKNLIRVVWENRAKNASQIVGQVLADLRRFMREKPITDEFTLAVMKLG